MGVLQCLGRDRNEFALVVGGATGFGIPLHASGPQDIRLAVAHAIDAVLQVLVVTDGCGGRELLVGLNVGKVVEAPPFRVLG